MKPRARSLVAAASAAVLALVVALVSISPWSRVPADALLTELAHATRDIAAQDLPEGSYVYVATEQLVLGDAATQVGDEWVYMQLLVPSRIEAWWQGDTVQLETTVDRPIFFDPEMEDIYYAGGLDEFDFVGETRVQFLTDITNQLDLGEWSVDPERLADQMRQAAEEDPGELPTEVRMIELAEQLLYPQYVAPPALRAAILDVLATIDLEQVRGDDGRVAASITYEDPGLGTVTKTLTFDADGYLVAREVTAVRSELLPSGTVFNRLVRTPPIIVPEPGVRPSE